MNNMLMHICAGDLVDESKAAADEAFIVSLNDRIVAASRDEADRPGPSSGGTSTPSFDDAGDDELASALSARIANLGEGLEVGSAPAARPVAALSGAPGAPALCMQFLAPAPAARSTWSQESQCRNWWPQAVLVSDRLLRACAGTELRESIQRKYGRTYDLSIVRRQLAGRTIVAMNVMVLPAAAKLP